MKPLRSRTLLAVALAMAWPAAPLLAAGMRVPTQSPQSQGRGEESPLRLTMSLQLTSPGALHPVGGRSSADNELALAERPSEPSDATVARLRLSAELVLRPQDSPAPDRLAKSASTPAPVPPKPPSAWQTALQAIERTDPAPWGRGPADTVVDDEFQRALRRYVRLQMPALPMWQAPRPQSPAELVMPTPRASQADSPQSDTPQALEPRSHRPAARARQGGRLRGLAWRLSDQGYKAYARGDYETALRRADAALKLRPDVVRLYQLRVYASIVMMRPSEPQQRPLQAATAVPNCKRPWKTCGPPLQVFQKFPPPPNTARPSPLPSLLTSSSRMESLRMRRPTPRLPCAPIQAKGHGLCCGSTLWKISNAMRKRSWQAARRLHWARQTPKRLGR